MKLFQTGMTNSEIATIVEALYDKKYSKQTITNITNEFIANVEAFRQRAIYSQFAVIYLDATYISIRRDTVAKEAIHIALGIKPDGTKEVLGYALAPQESAEIWNELLTDLRLRGLNKCSLFVTDGLTGIEDVITNNFPSGKVQRCLVHIQRNIKAQVRVKDQTEVSNDLRRYIT
jgi:transposase-like protein